MYKNDLRVQNLGEKIYSKTAFLETLALIHFTTKQRPLDASGA